MKTAANNKKSKSEVRIYPMFLTPEQAAEVSGLGITLIRSLMDEHKLEFLAIGRRKVTTIEALMDYYRRERTPAEA